VTPVLGIIEDLAGLGKDARRQGDGPVDRPVLGEKIDFVPFFPCLERFAVDFGRKPDTVPLLDVEANDENPSSAREVGSVFPKRAVRGVVMLPDFYRFDDSVSPNRKVTRNRASFRASPSYSHA
jgi:hypothetical protein